MSYRNLFTHTKSFRKATGYFELLTLALESRDTVSLEKELATLKDLRVINMVISCTFRARMQGFLSPTQQVLKTLMLAHAKEVIEGISSADDLSKINDTLQQDAAIDSFCTNEIEDLIEARLKQLHPC